MSTKYPGGIISKTAPTPSGPYSTDTAPGVWTLEQQAYWQKLGQWPTAGNVNPNAFIENLFSTYLYTGNGSTQTITNGIDLSTYGGLVWAKMRSNGSATGNVLFDTARGASQKLETNTTGASSNWTPYGVSAFGSTGFTVADDGAGNYITNNGGVNYASWTFRKQAKFFDMVTYSGSNSTQTISHNLGSTPGCIIIKKLDSNTFNAGWSVYHRSLSNPDNYYLVLNTDAGQANYGGAYISSVNSSTFTIAGGAGGISIAGSTYIAYIFAHNAGGFGVSGTDNVISCGSFTTDGSGNATVTLGYEPQWILTKQSNGTNSWGIYDTMRAWSFSEQKYLLPDMSSAEGTINATNFVPTATGFTTSSPFATSAPYIYIAIRRGPMAVPTLGTSVFSPVAYSGTGATRTITAGFPVDLAIPKLRSAATNSAEWYTRLIGPNLALLSASAFQEVSRPNELTSFASNTGVVLGNSSTSGGTNASGQTYVDWNFQRAPGFFDAVCWTRSTTTATLNHNLGVIPELIIKKDRSRAGTYWDTLPNSSPYDYRYDIYLNDTQAISGPSGSIYWNAAPTATTFDVNMNFDGSSNGDNFIAYLFASCPGVSKVGSYTGTGTTKQVDCGFTGGARFVMIKRTDSTGDWYVWDSARGIVAGNDPYLLMNSVAADVTGTDYVDTYSAGFEISSTAPSAINASGGTFIFLAIA